MLRSLLCLMLAWPIGGCQRHQAMDDLARQEAIREFEEIKRIEADTGIRLGALATWEMSEELARQSRIHPHGDGIVLLLVGLRESARDKKIDPQARIEATATDLRGRTRPIAMRVERSAPDMIDYVGPIHIDPPDTLRFDVTIAHRDGTVKHVHFRERFKP
jgi:hypothetical protein